MTEIWFNVGKENAVLDSSARILIPDEGQLLQIPYQFKGPAYRGIITSTSERRPEKDAPKFHVVSSSSPDTSTNLVWIHERQQWVAFEKSWNYGRTDNYGFSDDSLSLQGPWLLDISCKMAIIQAYGKSISPEYDISLADEIIPYRWENGKSLVEDILQDEKDQRAVALKISAEDVYQMMQKSIHRNSDAYTYKLRDLADVLSRIKRYTEPQAIKLSGWRRDGEYHGGYDYTEGSRDYLGSGRLLYQGKIVANDLAIEIWRSRLREHTRTLVLAIKTSEETGYVGIDNHYGTDYLWEVVGMRVF